VNSRTSPNRITAGTVFLFRDSTSAMTCAAASTMRWESVSSHHPVADGLRSFLVARFPSHGGRSCESATVIDWPRLAVVPISFRLLATGK